MSRKLPARCREASRSGLAQRDLGRLAAMRALGSAKFSGYLRVLIAKWLCQRSSSPGAAGCCEAFGKATAAGHRKIFVRRDARGPMRMPGCPIFVSTSSSISRSSWGVDGSRSTHRYSRARPSRRSPRAERISNDDQDEGRRSGASAAPADLALREAAPRHNPTRPGACHRSRRRAPVTDSSATKSTMSVATVHDAHLRSPSQFCGGPREIPLDQRISQLTPIS